ncbi:PAS domain-containing protein [Chenggangzhangella methanolivorans]|uniref:PAS domain-containing protein n=1 Tax=Chenggangzhangella methanolivorans TaxID=1437009 RepID=A0A9E6UN75_9HYPH|nr:PAS domain-containing protein [Chenggangzhangella methanolivorans]QZO00751.1 PAS domain-containing protein [Chenggangzhangella methanolivorans]
MKAAATKDLFGYWNRLRGERAAPERADVDPAAIRSALGDTFILEADQDSGYPFRLSGSRICSITGHEMKGESFLSLWSGPDRATVLGALGTVSDDAAVAVIGAQGSTDLGRKLDLEIGLLPLRHRGRTHARLLGSLAPVETPYWLGACLVTRFELTSLRMIWPSGRRRPMESPMAPAASTIAAVGRKIGRFMVFDGGR